MHADVLNYCDGLCDVQCIDEKEEKNIPDSCIRQVSLHSLPPIGNNLNNDNKLNTSATVTKPEYVREKIDHL